MSSRLATQFLLIKSAFLVFFSVGIKLTLKIEIKFEAGATMRALIT